MRVLVRLAVSLFFTTSIAFAAPEALTEDQRVGEGLMLILKGEKDKAWQILFPEAKKGNVVAMFHLGSMMMRSPEYPDYLERAEQFFNAAAQRGHAGSKVLLGQVETMLKKKSVGTPTLIAGVSGGPTPEQIADAKRRVEKYKNEVLRYTGYVEQVPYKATIKVFLPQSGESAESIYSTVSSLTSRFPDAIKVEYYVVIDPAAWKPDRSSLPASKIPPNGFTPDFKGAIAATFGIKSTPAIVVAPAQGNAKVISDPNQLFSEMSNLL
jgi:hypothetical protein